MSTSELQIQIFQHIKAKLPSHISLVDELAQVMDVSTDSAYRRIRGEKPISLEEIFFSCSCIASDPPISPTPTIAILFLSMMLDDHLDNVLYATTMLLLIPAGPLYP